MCTCQLRKGSNQNVGKSTKHRQYAVYVNELLYQAALIPEHCRKNLKGALVVQRNVTKCGDGYQFAVANSASEKEKSAFAEFEMMYIFQNEWAQLGLYIKVFRSIQG